MMESYNRVLKNAIEKLLLFITQENSREFGQFATGGGMRSSGDLDPPAGSEDGLRQFLSRPEDGSRPEDAVRHDRPFPDFGVLLDDRFGADPRRGPDLRARGDEHGRVDHGTSRDGGGKACFPRSFGQDPKRSAQVFGGGAEVQEIAGGEESEDGRA